MLCALILAAHSSHSLHSLVQIDSMQAYSMLHACRQHTLHTLTHCIAVAASMHHHTHSRVHILAAMHIVHTGSIQHSSIHTLMNDNAAVNHNALSMGVFWAIVALRASPHALNRCMR